MKTASDNPIRKGFRTVTPYVTVHQAAGLIEFVKQAFGAEEKIRNVGSAGGIHAEVRIGDSMMMIGGGDAWRGTPMPSAFHLYVPDADEVYQRAVRAGAVLLHGPLDDYGERFACVRDPAGNEWYIATHQGPVYIPEGLTNLMIYLHPVGAPAQIDFLKQAFGAEEVVRYDSPEGKVLHAKIRLGNSIVELGEAHGPWQPMPSMLYLYVPDADEVYARAIAAGGTSLCEPADQPYGDRNGGVRDPFGNHWYIATHLGSR